MCPSGHPIINPLLKPNLRFQVTFVTNSSSISRGSGTGPDTLIGGGKTHYPSSHVRAHSENLYQLTVYNSGKQFAGKLPEGDSKRPSQSERHHLPCICFCSPLQDPPPLGSWGVAPGHSQDTPNNS